MGFIQNELRVHRAGKIANANSRIKSIQEKSHLTQEDKDRLAKLQEKVARLEERNRIASEKNSRASQTVVNHKEVNIGSGNKTGLVDNDVKTSVSEPKEKAHPQKASKKKN